MRQDCPACGAPDPTVFYTPGSAPVHSVRLMHTKEEALRFPSGEIKLGYCSHCGFISNLSFDPNLQDYSAEYESTQAYSPTFNAFANRLAQQLVERYHLYNKKIIEIGCGQGEFLSLLCKLGDNRGVGFDPAYDPARSAIGDAKNVEVIADYYSEKYAGEQADFICCKMTLEHIFNVQEFAGMLRKAIGGRHNTTVFFQVPDVDRVLKEFAFWDIYYEHCSYFSMGSIARLFRSQAFDVQNLWRDYGDQYLMLDARPAPQATQTSLPQEDDLEDVISSVKQFSERITSVLQHWKETIHQAVQKGQKVALWGSGSKGVAFLTTLDLCEEIEYTVDINPNKHNTYLAGTGHKVVGPDFLQEYPADIVVLMNPLYLEEVQQDLGRLGLQPEIITVGT